MSREPTNVEKMRGLPWDIAASSANTVFAQFTFFGSAFILFLSQLGMSKSLIGFMLSLFPFFGLIALFIAPRVAHYGYKRTFLTFWGLRKIVAVFLLLTPWVLSNYGLSATVVFVTIVVGIFAICRAVGEVGKYPWTQEYIPNSVRGKYSALSSIFTTIAGLAAVTVAGYVVEKASGLTGFMMLIAAGSLFGFASIWMFSKVPGGAPVHEEDKGEQETGSLWETFQDSGFVSYLVGVGLVTLATVPMVSFLPLFMQEQVGLSSGNVVLLQNGTLLGGLLSSYLWGWAADRYGSKPIMLSGVLTRVILPVLWILMPRHSALSLYAALGIAVAQGLANTGWAIGSGRLLFVSIVPPAKKSQYMALYYAWIGVTGGLSQLVGGFVLDISQGISGQLMGITLDPYLPLFLLGLILPVVSWFVFRRTPADSGVSIGEFAGMFLRGNPFQAMGSLVRYYHARGEHEMVAMTERLSRAGSPLAVEELLEALEDPRFHVRFEALVSIARMKPDPRLTEALVSLLNGSELALSTVAAWALGRIGDDDAQGPLHEALNSEYRSIRAHSARALATLDDTEIAPLLLERIVVESDPGLRMAYASALGQLRQKEAVFPLLTLLDETENKGARIELALSLARIVGDEHNFVQLLRHVRSDAATATSQATTALRRRWRRLDIRNEELMAMAEECAVILGQGDLDGGAKLISKMIVLLPEDRLTAASQAILMACAQDLEELGASRIEYLILALHIMEVGWRK